MTTIKDIAREAGFSVSTVSRVLGGHPDVSPSTATAVRAVVERRRFVVNRNARNLKRAATTSVLVMVKGRSNLLFASMLEHVQAAVATTQFSVVTRYLDEDADEVAQAERLVAELKPRGVIFLGGEADHFAAAHRIGVDCPGVVLTNSVGNGLAGVSSVTTDDQAAAQMAVSFLLERGHRAIGVIGGNPTHSMMSAHRRDGVIAALRDAGLHLDDTHYVATRYSLEAGYEAARALMQSDPAPSAIYAMSDIMALGAIRALFELGLAVPGDVSVMGHDGIGLATYSVPRLATIRQPQEAMARQGVEILLRHINGDATSVTQFVPIDVVAGESVRALR